MIVQPKRALISVSDKTGVIEFARKLAERGVDIVSTGGTAKLLAAEGVSITEISDFTGSPEILDGRVKTLHPKVHGGILNVRDNPEHQKTMTDMNLSDIDIVCVNLYPFEATVAKPGAADEDVIENIDIGGPSMVRSAAKNHRFVAIITDTADYDRVLSEIDSGGTTLETRRDLARKAFGHTAVYDGIIAAWFNRTAGIEYPEELAIPIRFRQGMRYGENPHQSAAFYTQPLITEPSVSNAEQLSGKELSFNNIIDINAAVELVKEFRDTPACVIIKHTNPCGTATGNTLSDAYEKALAVDPLSAFGGIVGFNAAVDDALAEKLSEIFLEVIIAPDFTPGAIEKLTAKKNLRLMKIGDLTSFTRDTEPDMKKVVGGILLQERDLHEINDITAADVPTSRKPTDDEYAAMAFAWKVAKHVKSNAIIYAGPTASIGVGAGQMSRVDSAKIAGSKAQSSINGAVMASDAFFPFRDSIDEAARCGITAIISPGGSIRDEEVINAANEHGISMVFTGIRHFKH